MPYRKSSSRPSAKSTRAKAPLKSSRKRPSAARKSTVRQTRTTKPLRHTTAEAGRLLVFHRAMKRIRLAEEAIAAHYGEAEMRCPVHLSIGQEAVAVGSCEALVATDKIFSTHRCHAHYLAKGGDLRRMLAEIYGKAAGCVGGRGGSMHLMDIEKGVVASVPIVGSSIALAGGSALADKRAGRNHVTVAYFGDASVEEGVFHETANLAALYKLPIIFVCENNLFSVYTPLRERQPSRPLTDLAEAHGIATRHGDGNDVVEVHRMTRAAVDRARKGKGPAFLLFDTYRWLEHCGPNYDNAIGYRTEAEFRRWKKRDPIGRLARHLRAAGQLSAEREAEINTEIAAEIAAAIEFARSAPLPTPDQAALHVYA